MNETFTKEERDKMNIDPESLSYALLISNVSVLLVGVVLIGRACFNTSEGDFLDVGFDEHYDEYGKEGEKENSSDSHKEHDELKNFLFTKPKREKENEGRNDDYEMKSKEEDGQGGGIVEMVNPLKTH